MILLCLTELPLWNDWCELRKEATVKWKELSDSQRSSFIKKANSRHKCKGATWVSKVEHRLKPATELPLRKRKRQTTNEEGQQKRRKE